MYIRTVFDAPGFDAEFVELLEGQAIRAAAVKQLVRRPRTPNGSDQIDNIFPVKGAFENVFIALIGSILPEIGIGDHPAPINRDIHPDLTREFTFAHLGNTWLFDVRHLCNPLFSSSPHVPCGIISENGDYPWLCLRYPDEATSAAR